MLVTILHLETKYDMAHRKVRSKSSNERKFLIRDEIIDSTAEKTVSKITHVCKETKLWIDPNLRRPNFSFIH